MKNKNYTKVESATGVYWMNEIFILINYNSVKGLKNRFAVSLQTYFSFHLAPSRGRYRFHIFNKHQNDAWGAIYSKSTM